MMHIELGNLEVSRIGLGAMGCRPPIPGAGTDDAESIRTIHRALDLGITLIDTVELTAGQTSMLDNLTPAAGDTHEEADIRLIGR
jgi:predicted aldo/keto reductase-like oxidoreductase